LPSGNYFLNIKASDGALLTNSYIRLYLHEAARVFKHAVIITKAPAQYLSMNVYDNNLQADFKGNISSDFGYAAYEPIDKLLYVSGKYQRYLYCYDLENNLLKWQTQVSGSQPNIFFNDMALFGKKVYVSLRNQAIVAYNDGGQMAAMIQSEDGFYPDKMLFHDNLIITSQRLFSSQNGFIVVYYQSSGAMAQFLQTGLHPVRFFARDTYHIFVFANSPTGQAELRIYDLASNNTWQPYSLPPGRIIAVEKISNNNFLIAYTNRIYNYSYSPSSLTTFVDNIQTESMRYETGSQLLWVGTKDKKIGLYNYPFGTLINETILTDSIKDIVLIYNK